MDEFESFLASKFGVGKFAAKWLSLMRCNIGQADDFSIRLFQKQVISQINALFLADAASPKGDQEATAKQATVYRHIIRKILYIGRVSAPLGLFHASMSATKLSDLRAQHLRCLTAILNCVKERDETLCFASTPPHTNGLPSLIFDELSDGAIASKIESKEREVLIIFRRLGETIHAMQEFARCLRPIAWRSSTAETLAAAYAISSDLYIIELTSSMLGSPRI